MSIVSHAQIEKNEIISERQRNKEFICRADYQHVACDLYQAQETMIYLGQDENNQERNDSIVFATIAIHHQASPYPDYEKIGPFLREKLDLTYFWRKCDKWCFTSSGRNAWQSCDHVTNGNINCLTSNKTRSFSGWKLSFLKRKMSSQLRKDWRVEKRD